ncbi:MAG: hypothetical protein ACRDMZ_18550, partial [Solirubrobacteraceae bacterium]
MSTRPGEREPKTTGRSVVVFGDDVCGDRDAIASALRALAGVTGVNTADFRAEPLDPAAAAEAEAITFDALGIAVVARDPGTLSSALAADGVPAGAIVAIEPEHVLYAIEA